MLTVKQIARPEIVDTLYIELLFFFHENLSPRKDSKQFTIILE